MSNVKRRAAHVASACAAAVLLLLAMPGVAAADPAEPTNYLSTVSGLEPNVPGVTIGIDGGDAFLTITVTEGHEVAIPGYNGEPYLRIDADGSVWMNLDSPTRYINEERYGRVDVPDTASADAAPRWDLVAAGGTYAWHDHRTHWMNFDRPPSVVGSERQVVFPWKLPIEVDGTRVEVTGILEWLPSHSPLLPGLIGLAVLVPFLVPARRRFTATILLVAAGVVGMLLDVGEAAGTPSQARAVPALILFPALAIVAGAIGLVFRNKDGPARWAMLAGGLLLVVWAAANSDVLWKPVLISAVPGPLERILVAAVGWLGIGVLGVWLAAFVRRLSART